MESKNSLQGTRILVVEDDTFLGEMVMQKLQNEGAQLKYATTGEDAVSALEKEAIDLILLDILLPGIDGFEVLRRIRAHQEYKSIPVVVLSNLSSNGDVKRCLELGATRFFNKSVQPLNAVIEALAPMLGDKQTATQ